MKIDGESVGVIENWFNEFHLEVGLSVKEAIVFIFSTSVEWKQQRDFSGKWKFHLINDHSIEIELLVIEATISDWN